jgi:uncharacterized protein YndB with AHSA1/START domain
MDSDRIVKTVVLAAPRERVWKALSDSREFGTWFGARIDGAFEPGIRLRAAVVPTAVDADIAARQKPYDGLPFELVVERVEPMERLSFRWHPGGVDPAIDYSQEPMTLVTFELEDAPGGTRLTIQVTQAPGRVLFGVGLQRRWRRAPGTERAVRCTSLRGSGRRAPRATLSRSRLTGTRRDR